MDRLECDTSMCFRSKNSYVKIMYEDECLYETGLTKAPFYNKSPGTRWNYVNIARELSGKTIEMRILMAYDDGRAKVDNITLGDRGYQMIQIIRNKAVACLGFGLIVDLIRYMISDVLDRAFYMRIGLLLFIICFGYAHVYQLIKMLERGINAEFISTLAYTDGLTGIGNRTAYMEKRISE